MGWRDRRWPADEDFFTSAQQSVQGVSDDDVADALARALIQESARQGGDR